MLIFNNNGTFSSLTDQIVVKKHDVVIVLHFYIEKIIDIIALLCLREAGSALLCNGQKSPPQPLKKPQFWGFFLFHPMCKSLIFAV